MKYQRVTLFFKVSHIAMVGLGIVSLLSGCSSKLRTTMVTGTEAQTMEIVQLEAESFVPEPVQAQPIMEEKSSTVPAFDIPVEEPARPVIRPHASKEIFATSKTDDDSLSQALRTDSEPVPMTEETAVGQLPRTELSMNGIPPVSFEPELPAMPMLRHENGLSELQENSEMAATSSGNESQVQEQVGQLPTELSTDGLVEESNIVAQTAVEENNDSAASVMSGEEAPIQVAKVMPQEARDAEITTEALEAALSDVYFDYDQFAIREDAQVRLKANAQLLTGQLADKRIVIEGHCDERGTQSYNIVLGERRAKAVKHFLQDLGVPEKHLQIVTFGKDKPFCLDSTETCRQENRRGHFVIKE